MNSDIRHLSQAQLPTPLCYQLADIISAYRPHTSPNIDQEDKKEVESYVGKDAILSTYEAIKTQKDLNFIEAKRKYLLQWSGCRSHYLGG